MLSAHAPRSFISVILCGIEKLLNRTTVRQRIRTMLATGALTADELADAVDESEATIRKTLARMVEGGGSSPTPRLTALLGGSAHE